MQRGGGTPGAVRNLCINVKKTKEMLVDFRRDKDPLQPLYIQLASVEVFSSYRYLGVYISNDLTWSTNTSRMVRKIHQCLYFLRKLRRAGLGNSVLRSFYRCVVGIILCITVWHSRCTAAERMALQRMQSSSCTEDCEEQPFLHLGPLRSTMQEEGAPHHEGLHPSST
ncbi:hypothetical protein CCH79_00010204 [Gambusia affinis]|uniref:Alkylated DNA repair protein AlkB homologue 8 N-terminal domain-containing protein n=1 Tax=Gambusia affinis TaxID=33528 RepID=A0A315VMB9_GAMAF|nr:hypothetical protein CCH79_00010204 [Gambusia affinis]